MLEAGKALKALHAARLLHRDVKPANILRSEDGRVVLADLGLVAGDDFESLTRTGYLVGTLAYLAPEVFLGTPMNQSTDWYAWGMTLYELLEGRGVVDELAPDRLRSGERLPPPEFTRTSPDSPEAEVVRRCLAWEPADRPSGLAEIQLLFDAAPPSSIDPEALTAPIVVEERPPAPPSPPAPATPGPPPRMPPRRRGVALAISGLCFCLLGFLATSASRTADPTTPLEVVEASPAPTTSGPLWATLRKELDSTPNLTRDPAEFRANLRHLPRLWAFLQELPRSRPFDDLSAHDRGAWRDLDAAYRRVLGEPVLDAYLAEFPSVDTFQLPGPFADLVLPHVLPTMEVRSPKVAGALQAMAEMLTQEAELQAELDANPNGVVDGEELAGLGGMFGSLQLQGYASSVSLRPGPRTQVRDFMIEGILAFRRATVLAHRALEAGERDGELLGLLARSMAGEKGGFFVSGMATLPPPLLDGGVPTHPATWSFRAALVRKARLRINDFDVPQETSLEELMEMLRRAMGPGPPPAAPAEFVDLRRSFALYRQIEQAVRFDRPELAVEGLEKGADWLVATPQSHTANLKRRLGAYLERTEGTDLLSPEMRRRLQAVLP
jgi:hypothetical protein